MFAIFLFPFSVAVRSSCKLKIDYCFRVRGPPAGRGVCLRFSVRFYALTAGLIKRDVVLDVFGRRGIALGVFR
ncbi:hypothetical protein CIF55_12520, partial [Neisseria gonorrhoeae]